MTSSTPTPQPPPPTPVHFDVRAVPTTSGTASASKRVSPSISPGEIVTLEVTLSKPAPAGVPALQIATVVAPNVPGRYLWYSLFVGFAVGAGIILLFSTTPSKAVGTGIALLGALFAWANSASDVPPWLGGPKASVWITGISLGAGVLIIVVGP
jgi:hypothetical protein